MIATYVAETVTDAPSVNVLLNVVQVAILVALLKWIQKGNGHK